MEKTPGITPDMLSAYTGISVQELMALLLEMELKEWITVEPGNSYKSRIRVG